MENLYVICEGKEAKSVEDYFFSQGVIYCDGSTTNEAYAYNVGVEWSRFSSSWEMFTGFGIGDTGISYERFKALRHLPLQELMNKALFLPRNYRFLNKII